MEAGNIVEYIDRRKIVCAVVLEARNGRLRLLNENNRELKMSSSRLAHGSTAPLAPDIGRDRMVDALREAAERRRALAESVDVVELWEVLHDEAEWIDLATMTEFAFPEEPDGDHAAAVVRAFFQNRLFFKFSGDQFFPHTEEQVARLQAQAREEARRARLVEAGGDWVRNVREGVAPAADGEGEAKRFVEILRSFYLMEKESPEADLAREIMARGGLEGPESIFDLFVSLGVWDRDENVDRMRLEIPVEFPGAVETAAEEAARRLSLPPGEARRDLTDLRIFTIDGQATLDYDDALSIESVGGRIRLGVHIADVGHFVARDDAVDREALTRGSSIYMPDQRIPMLPHRLAEGACSLRAGEVRPAITTQVDLNPSGEVVDFDVFPSRIRVTDQLTYFDVNAATDTDPDLRAMYEVARRFRKRRLEDGAVQISLPEINLWFDEAGELALTRVNRESPSRVLVSEIMIMANWLKARFLAERALPAVFRSQPAPRERLYSEDGGSLFQNWMQRKLLSRFVLSPRPERHAGLGLDAYLTGTSPIRKFFDLITQRQIRSAFGLGSAYTEEEITRIAQALEAPMRNVFRLQNRRKRYWMLRHLEGRMGEKLEGIVLNRRRNGYQILLPEIMMETGLPASGGFNLKPEDMVQVTVQHVNARRDVLTVFMG
ncbi:MAG: ribonuclease catalytic domain-containing protein [Desulfococcaceae bacterium]